MLSRSLSRYTLTLPALDEGEVLPSVLPDGIGNHGIDQVTRIAQFRLLFARGFNR